MIAVSDYRLGWHLEEVWLVASLLEEVFYSAQILNGLLPWTLQIKQFSKLYQALLLLNTTANAT